MAQSWRLSKLIAVIWWVCACWLALTFLGIGYWFIRYLADADNPARIEYGIGAAIIAFYSWPAALVMLVIVLLRGKHLSTPKRIGGIGLVLACVSLLALFR